MLPGLFRAPRTAPPARRLARGRSAVLGVVLACVLPACAAPPPPPTVDLEVYRRAEAKRIENLEREIERLRADLREAEAALVAAESGLRGSHIRADAVSALAQARIELERASRSAPWRRREIGEARAKLEEAERQLAEGHIGSAIFFASRTSRIASTLLTEARHVSAAPNKRFVRARRVNLRAEPSTQAPIRAVLEQGQPLYPERQDGEWLLVRTPLGSVGWIHASLVR